MIVLKLNLVCFQISESSAGGSSSRRPVQAYKKSVTSSRLPNISNYEDYEFNNNNNSNSFLGEGEDRRKKEVEDLISKYAKKKDNDEEIHQGPIFVIFLILHSYNITCHFFR